MWPEERETSMNRSRKWLVVAALSVAVLTMWVSAEFGQQAEGRLMRFPDLSRDQIAFSYGGVHASEARILPFAGLWRMLGA